MVRTRVQRIQGLTRKFNTFPPLHDVVVKSKFKEGRNKTASIVRSAKRQGILKRHPDHKTYGYDHGPGAMLPK